VATVLATILESFEHKLNTGALRYVYHFADPIAYLKSKHYDLGISLDVYKNGMNS